MKNNGLKYDENKLRWDLLPLDIVEEVVKVYTFGCKKYKPNSWQNVENGRERYYAALMRHISSWRKGEIINKEDNNVLHLAQVIWNAIALIYFDRINNNMITKEL